MAIQFKTSIDPGWQIEHGGRECPQSVEDSPQSKVGKLRPFHVPESSHWQCEKRAESGPNRGRLTSLLDHVEVLDKFE